MALENDARTLENIGATGVFSVNFLSQDYASIALAEKFAQPYYDAKIRGRGGSAVPVHHKLDSVSHTLSPSGCPVLTGAMAWFDCGVEERIPVGDHTLVVGRVLKVRRFETGEVLTSAYTGWNYSG